MTTALATTNGADLAEQVAIAGDLANLTPDQRMTYYGEVCRSMGLNPLTRPFEYIELNGKLTLYARRDATDQLRKIYGVNISIVARETVEGVYVVTARATTADGRTDESVGAVPLVKESGEWKTSQGGKRYFAGDGTYRPIGPEDRANAMMKAETKAKRRVTLSIVGLGWLDETELETIPSIRHTTVDNTGEIRDIAPDNGPPASDKQRRYIASLQDDLGWHSEYMAQFAREHKIDLMALSKADATYLIEQMKMAGEENTNSQPDPKLVASLKKLRECEAKTSGNPPMFTQKQARDAAAVELEWVDSRRRIYNWITSKVEAAPDIEELDDQSLIDLAIATKEL